MRRTDVLGAEHIRASHGVSKCRETLGAERIRASQIVSKGNEILAAEADSTTRTLMKTP